MTVVPSPGGEAFHSRRVQSPGRATGLSEKEAHRRLKRYGPNEIERERGPSLCGMLAAQLGDVMILLLMGAAALSCIAGEWMDSAVIAAIVVVNAVTGVVQEHRAARALAALREMAAPAAKVFRQGKWRTVPCRDLVPGDLVSVETGDRVPADLDIVEAVCLEVDESVLTGESAPVQKTGAGKEQLFASTTVVRGRCKGIVARTGMATRVGLLARQIRESSGEEPPLKKRLDAIGRNIATACLLLVGVTFLLGVSRGEEWLEMFLTSVSLGVAAIPEGLPAVVTVVLAIGVRRMSAKRAIIRKLASVETLGSVTAICSDKTGTLTKNEMSVAEIFAGGEMFVLDDNDARLAGAARPDSPLQRALLGGLLASDAVVEKERAGWRVTGDPTEGALVMAAARAGLDREHCERLYPRVFE
ncbi:MAG: HAD-IC family P-type ATPase, partial [Firmicutes bacterium]|nr:HAD-IC family P-type ATPase [Bacillota bacterium]